MRTSVRSTPSGGYGGRGLRRTRPPGGTHPPAIARPRLASGALATAGGELRPVHVQVLDPDAAGGDPDQRVGPDLAPAGAVVHRLGGPPHAPPPRRAVA